LEVAALNETINMPLVIHDLQDSQMFALAQAAGRAGLKVQGTCQPMESWLKHSRYIDKVAEMACLGDVNSSVYALNLRNAQLSGVWLPCTDDLVEFTARYQPLLKNIGMQFLSPSEDQFMMTRHYHRLPEVQGLDRLFGGAIGVASLYENISSLPYPLMIKAERGLYHTIDSEEEFKRFLEQHGGEKHLEDVLHVQAWVAGVVQRMASAMLLFDDDSRPVRGFTGRRQRVVPTAYGRFGETTAAQAEWIPELYEGAVELLQAMKWKGFAEVECKQAEDGRWKILEINPRLSGWTCLAEADGAGFLAAYHRICAEGTVLEEACLQRSKASYRRLIGTCYHDPDWAVATEENDSIGKRIARLWYAVKAYRAAPNEVSLGAWDGQDLRASLALLWRTVWRVWAIARGKKKLF